ncbi:hypothetical protein [Bartonella gliris]|uniref:hypothetical protein n=1 Tax=Bartonella gliris TaxID=3004109 RepID=UPI003873C5C2
MKEVKKMKGQNLVLDKKQLSLSWQDYKKIFYISTFVVVTLITVSLVFHANWGEGILSFRIFLPIAWGLLCALLFLPVILVSRIIVTGKLRKMIQQLQEEAEQQEKRMTALGTADAEKE